MGRTKSKRVKLAVKYHRIKKIKQMKKKMKKFARLNPELVANMRKRRTLNTCPNTYPHKAEVIQQTKEEKLKQQLLEQRRKEKRAQRKIEHIAKQQELKEKQQQEYSMLATPQDPRDPINSRNVNMEQYILNLQQKDATKNIQLYYVLNKIDLIPAEVLQEYVYYFNTILQIPLLLTISLSEKVLKQYRTGDFYNAEAVSQTPFDDLAQKFTKSQIETVLEQYNAQNDVPNVTVSVIGYNNVGKSSLINTLLYTMKTQKELQSGVVDYCDVSPNQNTTKVAKYIKFNNKITFVDTPALQLDIDYTKFATKGKKDELTLTEIPYVAKYQTSLSSYKFFELLYLSAYINNVYKQNVIYAANNIIAQLIEAKDGKTPVLPQKFMQKLYNIPEYKTFPQFITYFAHVYGFIDVKKTNNDQNASDNSNKVTQIQYDNASFTIFQLFVNTISTTTQSFHGKNNNTKYSNKNIFFYTTQVKEKIAQYKAVEAKNAAAKAEAAKKAAQAQAKLKKAKKQTAAAATPTMTDIVEEVYEPTEEEQLIKQVTANTQNQAKFVDTNTELLSKFVNVIKSHTTASAKLSNTAKKSASQYTFPTLDNTVGINTQLELDLDYAVSLPKQYMDNKAAKKQAEQAAAAKNNAMGDDDFDEDDFDDEDMEDDEDDFDFDEDAFDEMMGDMEGEDLFGMYEGEDGMYGFDEDEDEDLDDEEADAEYMRMLTASLDKTKKAASSAGKHVPTPVVEVKGKKTAAAPVAKAAVVAKPVAKKAAATKMAVQDDSDDDAYDWSVLG